jgi:DNA primase catalytic subunit
MFFSSSVDPDVLTRIATLDGKWKFENRRFAAEFAHFSGEGQYMKRDLSFLSAIALIEWARTQSGLISLHMEALTLIGSETREREIVLDIDVTDYADHCACECAQQKKACIVCWKFIQMAIKCLSRVFDQALGIERTNIFWFFSGNRGVHCFLVDKRYLYRDGETRAAIAEYFTYSRDKPMTMDQIALIAEIRDFYCNELNGSRDASDEDVLAVVWPKIDKRVTSGISHLIRCPFSRNQKSGLFSHLIEAEDPWTYVPMAFLVKQ